jgi:type II secretory pathway predicted ATPase ExeA
MTATTTPWVTHFGFSRTPFTKRIAARDLYLRDAHAEAVARICFCVADAALGVVCGEVGAGKTVAVRAAVATLDQTRHHLIYVPNPAFGTRGLYVAIVSALGANPASTKPKSCVKPPTCSPPRKPNATAASSWSSTKPTCYPPSNSRSSAC